MKMMELAFLAVGGVGGVFARYAITKSPLFLGVLPMNVLIVNIIGSFIVGVFAVLSLQWNLDQKYAMLVAMGFCGGLTTMSSFALEASNLLDNKQYLIVMANILTNVGLSIGAVFGGKGVAGLILEGGMK